jgi:hypothetical protein
MAKSVRDALERLPVPAEQPEFFDDLWKEAERRERASARRWRRGTAVLAVVVVGAASAAGVLAFGRDSNVIDRTLRCVVKPHGGLPYLNLIADPTIPGTAPGTTFPASMSLITGDNAQLFAFDTAHSGLVLDNSSCHPAKAFTLARAGLPSSGVFKGGQSLGFNFACHLAGPVVFRLRVVRDRAGTPTSAAVAVRLGKQSRPIAYVLWTPKRVAAYATGRCGG